MCKQKTTTKDELCREILDAIRPVMKELEKSKPGSQRYYILQKRLFEIVENICKK